MTEADINLTVIGDRLCSTTRTYLTHLRDAGFRPRALWLVDFGSPPGWRQRVRGLLAGLRSLGRSCGATENDDGFAALCLHLQEEAGFDPIDHTASWRPEDFADEVKVFHARDFNDHALLVRMLNSRDTAFLYTNGGLVPATLLDQPDLRVLHIHPGIVPELRGSDCLLWSAAVRQKLGVSCFYMSAGIDEGALIGQRSFDLPRMPSLAPWIAGQGESTAYRALLNAVDPHLRATLLVDVLNSHPGADLRRLPSCEQTRPSRPAYLWMHPRLRRQVMREAFL